MTENEIGKIVERQRAFFRSGATLTVDYRIRALEKLRRCIRENEKEIARALYKDLGKSAFESYMCETGLVLDELGYMLRHARAFSREKRVQTPLAQFASRSFQKPSPYGVTLVMSPWNYPFLLTLDPLVDAIAAGNTVVLKPSAYSPYTGELIGKLVAECFPKKYVAVITGGRAENACLLRERFDFIFFTGSQSVGKEVMRKAAEHLTPVALELGGKSPCIVERSADLKLAARRIVFGKFLNCGQTCVAPDYICCDRGIKDALVSELKKELLRQYGRKPLENPGYGKIINEKHFDRICGLLDKNKVIWGGESRRETLQIEPVIMDNVTYEDAVMKEEIFGPVLPVMTYDSLGKMLKEINEGPHPLALYIFTKNPSVAKKVTSLCSFGGGCVNDTVIHLATSHMGFGGFGESGMGAYHGRAGFEAFSHYKSIVDKKLRPDLPMRYQPYRESYEKLLHLFLK